MVKRIMREFRLDKIAAVDSPCQEGARAVIIKRADDEYWKRDFTADQRDNLAGTGAAMPDGCLAFDTMVETPYGQKQIGSLVGGATVLTDCGWRSAEIRCFGNKRLYEIALRRGNARRLVLATAAHRWYTQRGVVTTEFMRSGDRLPNVSRNAVNAAEFQPAETAVAAVAKEPTNSAGGMIVVNHERRPLSAGRGMAPAALGGCLADCTLAALSGEHALKVGMRDAVFTAQDATASCQPSFVADADLEAGGVGVRPLAGLAFSSVSPASDIELGRGLGFATKSASEIDDSASYWSNGFSSHFDNIADNWHVEQIKKTGITEPVYCAIVPGLHRFVIEGGILTGNSFPIQNRKDLENAIHAIGRAKDPDKAKAHIISRARSLGATDLLPDGWVSKSNHGHDGDIEMTEAELKKQIDDAVATATADLNKKLTEANAEVEKMKKAAKKPGNAAEDAVDGGADDAEETPMKAKKFADAVDKAVKAELAKRDEIAKGDEAFEYAGKTIRKSAVGEDVFAVMKAQADTIEIAEFTKRAESEFKSLPGEPVAKAKAIRAVSKLGKDEREAVETMLKAGEKAMADALKVVGKNGSNAGADAESKLDALAKTYATEHKVDFNKAYNAVLDTAEGRELYKQFTAERAA